MTLSLMHEFWPWDTGLKNDRLPPNTRLPYCTRQSGSSKGSLNAFWSRIKRGLADLPEGEPGRIRVTVYIHIDK